MEEVEEIMEYLIGEIMENHGKSWKSWKNPE